MGDSSDSVLICLQKCFPQLLKKVLPLSLCCHGLPKSEHVVLFKQTPLVFFHKLHSSLLFPNILYICYHNLTVFHCGSGNFNDQEKKKR